MQGGGDVTDSAADPYPPPAAQFCDQIPIVAFPTCGVDVDDRYLADQPESIEQWPRVACLDGQGLPFDQLNGLSSGDVDGRDDHGRTKIPAEDIAVFRTPTVV